MRDLLVSIYKIFKFCFRLLTGFRNLVFNILFIAVLIIVALSFLPKEINKIPKNSFLRLNIEGDIVEEKNNIEPFAGFIEDEFYAESPASETALQDILDAINNAAEDSNIDGIILDLKYMSGAGLNQLRTIGGYLAKFRQSGKQVVVYQEFYSQAQYYLASYADTVGLSPLGAVDLHGFGVYRLYFRDAMEKLGVTYNVFKVGEYKSALEPFTRNDMSEADKAQNREWLEALWGLFLEDVATNRRIPAQNIRDYTNNGPGELRRVDGDTAQVALQTGLVDQIWTRQQLESHMKQISGTSHKQPHYVSLDKYLAATDSSFKANTAAGKPVVGLIVAEGIILPGKQPPGQIGGTTLSELIRDARDDDNTKALVLRINSGGGSAFASENIRQELLEFKNTGRPVVISMGSLAASGGYWIASAADEIWAAEATITGSIGIFGAVPTFEKTLEGLGVYTDGIGTTPLSSGLSVTQPLSADMRDLFQQAIENNYERFLDIVAEGRGMAKEDVRKLAGGRVYDGVAAKENGLVDNLGELEQAIEAAASLAHLADYETQYIMPPVSVKEQVLRLFSGDFSGLLKTTASKQPLLDDLVRIIYEKFKLLAHFQDPKGVYAYWMSEFAM